MNQFPIFEKKNETEKKEDIPVSSSTGGWQRYTTGFGEKFMKKFGFDGRLGKDGQGIAQPIAVKKRPEGLGLGANGFKEASSLKANREIAKQYNKNAGIATEEKKEKKKDWWKSSESESDSYTSTDGENALSASDSDTPVEKKQKKVFKTLQQLLEEQEGAEETEVQPIVFTDHTGRTQTTRVLGESTVDRNAVGFEMIYNIEKLTSAEEMNVLSFASKRKRRDEMKQEKQILVSKMKSEIESQTTEIQNIETILRSIQAFSPKSPLDVLVFMEDLQINYPVEYYRYKLFQLLPSMLQPILQSTFAEWNPLTEAKQFEELVYHVKDIMLIEEEEEESRLFTYDWMENPSKKHEDENRFIVVSVFNNTLLQPIRQALLSNLNLFDETHFENYLILLRMARVIWEDVNVVEHITKPVISRLKLTLHSWSANSNLDHIQFFQSILRFQGYVHGYDSEIFPLVTTKMASYLDSFHSLKEARLFIQEIRSSFNVEYPAAKRALFNIENSIVLKLARNLRTFEIDPGNQENIELFIDTLQWCECLEGNTISAILEGEFFNKWLFVLYSWIHQEEVNLMEIVNWIEGWRSLFPPSLLENAFVVQQFNRAWDIINDVVDKTNKVDPSYFEKPTTYLHVVQQRRMKENEAHLKKKLRKETIEAASMSIRDAVTMWGEKHNIEVIQVENKFVDGKQVFLFGNLQFYLSQNATFVKDADGTWKPQSLQDLLTLNCTMQDLDSIVFYIASRVFAIALKMFLLFYYLAVSITK